MNEPGNLLTREIKTMIHDRINAKFDGEKGKKRRFPELLTLKDAEKRPFITEFIVSYKSL